MAIMLLRFCQKFGKKKLLNFFFISERERYYKKMDVEDSY